MELSTKITGYTDMDRSQLVKSPKEALRKTLKNRLEREGLVVMLFPTSFVIRKKDAIGNCGG